MAHRKGAGVNHRCDDDDARRVDPPGELIDSQTNPNCSARQERELVAHQLHSAKHPEIARRYAWRARQRKTNLRSVRELRDVASCMGSEIVKVYKDHGISGAKGRDKRPAFQALCRDATKRQFDMVMAWSVDRLGRSL